MAKPTRYCSETELIFDVPDGEMTAVVTANGIGDAGPPSSAN